MIEFELFIICGIFCIYVEYFVYMCCSHKLSVAVSYPEKEISEALTAGGNVISLGRRILRTETAAITTVGACMLYAETELCND